MRYYVGEKRTLINLENYPYELSLQWEESTLAGPTVPKSAALEPRSTVRSLTQKVQKLLPMLLGSLGRLREASMRIGSLHV